MHVFELPAGIDRVEYEAYVSDSLDFHRLDLSRISELLKFQIYCGYKFRLFNSYAVSDEIKMLEFKDRKSLTKQADYFLYPPLRGLKKKHWTDASQIHRNLINEIKESRTKTALNCQVENFFNDNDGKLLTDELISEMVNIYTLGAMSSRATRNAMTGHWLIFAEYQGKNFYLTIAAHDEGDQVIFDRIKTVCFIEYPFLEKLLHD
jgi:hypothetical protein